MSYVPAGRGLGRVRRGLGQSVPLAYCQSLGFFDFVGSPGCWGWGVPNAVAYAGLPSTPAPVTSLPPPSNVPPASGAEAQSAVDTAVATNIAANQAANLAFFSGVANSGDAATSTVNWGLLLLVGAGFVVAVMVLQNLTRPSPYVR